jgi:hypothetical protein
MALRESSDRYLAKDGPSEGGKQSYSGSDTSGIIESRMGDDTRRSDSGPRTQVKIS